MWRWARVGNEFFFRERRLSDEPIDADPDNDTQDTLFEAAYLPAKAHNGWLNVYFADEHVNNYRAFSTHDMTFSYDLPGVPWAAVARQD